jgi:hypothetical protein
VYISLLYLILQVPLSLMGPSILTFFHMNLLGYIFFVMTHVSQPCFNTGLITVLYNRILLHRWICLDFSIGNNAQSDLFALHTLLLISSISLQLLVITVPRQVKCFTASVFLKIHSSETLLKCMPRQRPVHIVNKDLMNMQLRE